MRILFLTETIPYPLDSGGRIKTYHTIRSLADHHQIHCHAFIRNPAQRRHAHELERFCATLTLHLRPRSWAGEAVALAVRAAEEKRCDLAELGLDALRRFSPLIGEDALAVLSVEGSLASRAHLGGTAPEQVRAAIAKARQTLSHGDFPRS